jgi:hypothetical protein
MKKITLILGVLAIISLGSCTKSWTCACTDQSGVNSYHTVPNATLSSAKSTCDGFAYHNGALFNNCVIQ